MTEIQLPDPPPGKTGWPWETVPTDSPEPMDGPTITIVTPSYNQAGFIEETIRSVLLQNYPRMEYIVMDGGSTDGTVEILKKYDPFITFWTSGPDDGQSDAINRGWRRATGDIIAWLNSDDVYAPGALATAALAFRKDPALAMLYGNCNLIDENSRKFRESPTTPFSLKRLVCNEWFISQPATFFKRSLLERIGFLDRDLHLIMDWEFYLRIALGGHKIANCPETLANFRVWNDAKTSSQTTTSAQEKLDTLHRIFSDNNHAVDIRPYRNSAFHYVHNWASAQFGQNGHPGTALRHLLQAIRHKPSFFFNRKTIDRMLYYLRRT